MGEHTCEVCGRAGASIGEATGPAGNVVYDHADCPAAGERFFSSRRTWICDTCLRERVATRAEPNVDPAEPHLPRAVLAFECPACEAWVRQSRLRHAPEAYGVESIALARAAADARNETAPAGDPRLLFLD